MASLLTCSTCTPLYTIFHFKIFVGRSLAWDGYHVLVGGQNGILYLWDLEKFKLIYEVQTHTGKYFKSK